MPGERAPVTMSRRRFVGASLAAFPVLGRGTAGLTDEPQDAKKPVPKIVAHRRLGRTGWSVSDIGFGAGLFSNAPVLAAALDRGVNYIDTAEHYGNGESERTIGEVLKRRSDRKALFLTTKLNVARYGGNSKDELKERLRKCLERLQTDYVDCLMIHMCTLAQVKHEPYHEAIRELKAEGRVRFSGLSNHGPDMSVYGRLTDPMEQVIAAAAEDGRFDVALFVYNYLNTERGAKALAACKARNMGTTLMKTDPGLHIERDQSFLAPMKQRYTSQGKPVPDTIVAMEAQAAERAARARAFLDKHRIADPGKAREAAVTFALNNRDVHCACPSINNFQDLDAFVALSGRRMTIRDAALLADYADVTDDLYCRHACGTCEAACPNAVPVNTIMRYDYYFTAKGQEKSALVQYAALGDRDASPCAACDGGCERACPHGVRIQGRLLLAHHRLTMP